MEKLRSLLNYTFQLSENIHISIKTMLVLIIAFFITSLLLKVARRLINKQLEEEDKGKFKSIFSFLKYFIYLLVIIIAL